MKLRWKILIGIGIFLFLMTASLTVTMRVQPQNEVETYKKELLKQGEKLGISEVTPPPVPAESNGVALVQTAFGLIVSGSNEYSNLPPMMRMVGPGKAMIGWAQSNLLDPGPYGGFTNSWQNAAAAAAANRPAIDLLRQAAGYPVIDFQLDYSKGFGTLVMHLSPFKRSAQMLCADAMGDLHSGDAASAGTNICALALVRNQREDLLISQLVRIAMDSIAASATWEFLQATNLTDSELDGLQQNWERQEFIGGIQDAFLMERADIETTVQKMRTSSKEFAAYFGGSATGGSGSSGAPGDWLEAAKEWVSDTRESSALFMWRASWSYSDELRMLQGEQILLETVRAIKTNQTYNPFYTNMLSRLDAMGITNAPDDWLVGGVIPDYRRILSETLGGLRKTVLRAMTAEASRRIVVTAIALKRFQLKHGNFPVKLAELTPDFLPVVLLDPVDGKPLRYQRNDDGTYFLYSVGDDGVDNGGDVSPASPSYSSTYFYWQRCRDWVWPQPATPAEVQAYFEHPPK